MARRGAPRTAPSRRGMPRTLPVALSALVVALFFVAVGVWALAGRVPPEVLYVYGFSSLCTYILYAMDKSAARRGAWRTRESTLHLLSLAGGWPGPFSLNKRYVTNPARPPFLLALLVTVLVNCGALFVLIGVGAGRRPVVLSLQALTERRGGRRLAREADRIAHVLPVGLRGEVAEDDRRRIARVPGADAHA